MAERTNREREPRSERGPESDRERWERDRERERQYGLGHDRGWGWEGRREGQGYRPYEGPREYEGERDYERRGYSGRAYEGSRGHDYGPGAFTRQFQTGSELYGTGQRGYGTTWGRFG